MKNTNKEGLTEALRQWIELCIEQIAYKKRKEVELAESNQSTESQPEEKLLQ